MTLPLRSPTPKKQKQKRRSRVEVSIIIRRSYVESVWVQNAAALPSVPWNWVLDPEWVWPGLAACSGKLPCRQEGRAYCMETEFVHVLSLKKKNSCWRAFGSGQLLVRVCCTLRVLCWCAIGECVDVWVWTAAEVVMVCVHVYWNLGETERYTNGHVLFGNANKNDYLKSICVCSVCLCFEGSNHCSNWILYTMFLEYLWRHGPVDKHKLQFCSLLNYT